MVWRPELVRKLCWGKAVVSRANFEFSLLQQEVLRFVEIVPNFGTGNSSIELNGGGENRDKIACCNRFVYADGTSLIVLGRFIIRKLLSVVMACKRKLF